MVFESLVVDLINKYLGDYIAKLDKSQLKLGLLGGNATLENLDIKENAFDEFDLPIKVVQGHIGKLTLKIPWKHLYSEPVIAELDGLYVLVIPNSGMKYDKEKDRLFKLESKMKELNRIEEAKAKRNEPKKDDATKDSFGEKFAAQVVKNLQIIINNIHIRFEDPFTNPQRPFAVGITLANLSFQTCDSSGNIIVIKDDATKEFYKSVKMDSLALYWKSQPTIYNGLTRGQMKNAMKATISSSSNKVSELNYLIQPISCSSMMHVHMKPEATNFTVPQLSLDLSMDQIGFGFTRNQYCDLTTFLDSMDRVWTQNRFLKYRPTVSVKDDIKTWWLYPYTVIIEEQVRRRQRMWSWQYIREHRIRCRTYTELWVQKLMDKKLSNEQQKTIESCEQELDLLNITLCRQQADMKAKKAKKKLIDQKAASGGWFGGWFGKSDSSSSKLAKNADDDDNLKKKVSDEFTLDEKMKLYQAIGYSEQSNDTDIPKEYVSLKLKVVLHKLTVLLSDESLSEKKLVKLSIRSLSADVEQRSSADALKVGLVLSSMQVNGSTHGDGVVPILVSTQRASDGDNLLLIDFETNPLDASANQKINVRAEPLEIVYDSDTINRLVKFVTPPEELRLFELSNQVAASLEDVKDMTATGLRHLASQRLYTDIKVDIKPSYFIMPEHGSYQKDCKMLLLDLGSIIVRSERTSDVNAGDLNAMTKDGKLDYDRIKESAYDKFRITLSTIQMLLIEQGDDWRTLRSMTMSKNHVLRPCGFDIQLKKCAIANDVNLANVLIEGCLPNLGISISDRALQSILELILHVPFPQTEPTKIVPLKEDYLKVLDTSPFGIMGVELSGNQVLRAAVILPDSETASTVSTMDNDDDDEQFFDSSEQWNTRAGDSATKKAAKVARLSNIVDLEVIFVVTTAEVQIFEELQSVDIKDPEKRNEIVNLIVEDIGIILTMKRFDLNVQSYVGGLVFAVPRFTQPNTNQPFCLARTNKRTKDENLLFVKLMIAEKTSPDFVTFYKNTRHTLECNFKCLDVCLHQEALLLLLNFANCLITKLNLEEKDPMPDWSAKIGDKQGAQDATEKYAIHSDDNKKVFPVTSVINVVSDQREANKEKRNICLEAESEAALAGVQVYIPEISVTQWAVTASLEQLRVSLANVNCGLILDVSVNGMRADVKMTYRSTEIGLSLTDVRVKDPSPTAMFKKIMWIEPDDSIFSAQIVLFNQSTSTAGYELDLSRVDTVVRLEIGKVKVIFLYSFVNRIQMFLNAFQTEMQAVMDKAQQYSKVAVQQVANVLEEPPSSRISLDIKIDAPVIFVPEHSQSTNALVIDLGSMVFKNDFILADPSEAIIDVSTISLTNVRVSRSLLRENVIDNEKGILSPINIQVSMSRNLSWSKCNEIAQLDINVKMHAISVAMTQGDFTMLQVVLQSNLGEVASEPTRSYNDANIAQGSVVRPAIKDGAADDTKDKATEECKSALVTIKFAFEMEYMDLKLSKGELSPDQWNIDVPAERQLAKMTCDNLVVQGKMFLNTALEVDVRLNNIKLFDTQPGAETKINELVKTLSSETKDFISLKFLQDSKGNSKLIVDIAGIYVCICVDYLMQLADFFVKGQPPAKPQQSSPKKQILQSPDTEDRAKKSTREQKVVNEPRTSDFELDVHLERPEILLVENIDNPKSNAIMVQMEVALKYSMLKECDIVNAEVRDFEATFCPFDEKKRKKYSMDIVSPTMLAFYCNKPLNDGMQGTLTMEHLIVNITPAVIQNVSKIMASLNASPAKDGDTTTTDNKSIEQEHNEEQDNFWTVKKFGQSDFSFITKGMIDGKKDDNVESGIDVALMITEQNSQQRPDQIHIRLPDIRVVIESEVAKKCVPMLILECAVDGDLRNPLTQLMIEMTVSVSVSYFNDNINVWEPLVEVYIEENKRQYCFEIEYTTRDDSELFDEDSSDDTAFIESSAVSILLRSRDNLELTLSKTALDVLTKLGKAFEDAYSLNLESHKSVVGSPYMIKNSCGLDVVLYLNDEFDLKAFKDTDNVVLKNGCEIKLCDAKIERTLITDDKKARHIEIGFPGNTEYKERLSIHKSEIRALHIAKKESSLEVNGDLNMLVIETTAYLGMKNLEVRSVLQVVNGSKEDMELYYKAHRSQTSDKDSAFILVDKVLSGQTYNVPISALLDSDGHIYIGVLSPKTTISSTGICWKTVKAAVTPTNINVLECRDESSGVLYSYAANVTETKIRVGSSDEKEELVCTHRIHICAPVSLHNQLPIPIDYQSHASIDKIQPGCHQSILIVATDKSAIMKLNYFYEKKDWFGVFELRAKMEEFGVISFKAKDGFSDITMDLGVHCTVKDGHVSLVIYCPYWMINKTGHGLTYKADEEYILSHAPDNHEAVLFSFLSKSMFNKKKTSPSQSNIRALLPPEDSAAVTAVKETVDNTDVSSHDGKFAKTVKAYLKIEDSSWSDKFSLDTVGSNGKIICKKKPISFEIGVNINLSSSGLTKIVTFMPYYMIINKSSIPLKCEELISGASAVLVPPGEAVPFWPRSESAKTMLMRCMTQDNDSLVTQPFPFFETHSILMKLDKKYVGIFVDVQITEEANLITLQLYQEGMVLVELVNHLNDNTNIYYKQSGSNNEMVLPPMHSVMYAWQDPMLKKELIWRVDGDNKKNYTNALTADAIGEFHVNKKTAYWVSSVLEIHRVLLFTSNQHVAKCARVSTDLENIDMEVSISLHSIGLSLVDNSKLQEIAYISLTSSGIKWNQVRKRKQRPLKVAQSEALELAYDDYIRKMKVGQTVPDHGIVKIEDLEVDLSKRLMLKPEKCELTRMFEPGVYLQYRTSPHKMHVHMRVHRIQVDNQLDDCNFPVVFAPFPPPRSVTLETGWKPLIEIAAVIGKTSDGSSMRFKYFRVLIQEMQLMLDQGFVNSMLDFMSAGVTEVDEEDQFKKDRKIIDDCLIDTPIINAILQGGKKCVFDNFHISPIKIHLSFSLSRVSQSGKTALHSEVFNIFLQSVGIVVTDMQDVIFKLGYFEKQNNIMPMNQMVGVMTKHYISQALRQMYVLVLGLDVLGNPFGVIRGMAQGVEDLFYEPVKGAIMGPEEFAEGVAYGVKSLFGHAVGGAAGAVSRIVGTMGKGIAALTLDEDYQRKRREQMSRRHDNVGVGLAQGGKGLLVGFVQGVTGIVTKPIDGAKKDGVEGFFKGVGKGLVGVVTRPVSGVVDFASSSFEGIRRVADTNIEVYRIRPPRFIGQDGVIRNYGLREAEGNVIWKKVVEKSEALPGEAYVMHIYCKSRKQCLLLTDRRIVLVDHNDMLCTWSVYWALSYEKLDGVPTVDDKKGSIVFAMKEKQRRLFSKDNITKEIEADVGALRLLLARITAIMADSEAAAKRKMTK